MSAEPGRWARWREDGARMYIADTARGRVTCRAFSEEDARARIVVAYGTLSNPIDIRPVAPRLPYRGALAPSVALDVDGVLWGLSEDRPYDGPRAEFEACAGEHP